MMLLPKITGIVGLAFILLLASFAFAQDPGVADTLRLAELSENAGNLFSMPVELYNDEEISSIVVPLIIDGYSGWAKFDSVSYIGSRLSDVSILDAREAFVFATDTFSVDSLVLKFEVSSGDILPVGDGKLCDLWFSADFGGEVLLDSLPDSPYGGLRLTGASKDIFTPEFQPGMIDIACDYIIGNVRDDNDNVNLPDAVGFFKGVFGCQRMDQKPLYITDVNCDRHVDMRDGAALNSSIFGGPPLCECGTYTPALYEDPGIPDTIWIESDTLYVGIEDTIDIGVINDEPIIGLALALEWDGSANLWFHRHALQNHYSLVTDRIASLDFTDYWCVGDNDISPDTLYAFTWYAGYDGKTMQPGSGAICRYPCMGLTPGTVTFRLVPYQSGAETMLVTESGAAILPAISGGQITVLAYKCGDANHDIMINIGDAGFVINYIFYDGPAPDPIESGDANWDGGVNLADAGYVINFIFYDGPVPCCL